MKLHSKLIGHTRAEVETPDGLLTGDKMRGHVKKITEKFEIKVKLTTVELVLSYVIISFFLSVITLASETLLQDLLNSTDYSLVLIQITNGTRNKTIHI